MNAPIHVLIVHFAEMFWAMGEGGGTASFFRAAHSYREAGHQIDIVLPATTRNGPAEYHGMKMNYVHFGHDPLELGPGGWRGMPGRLFRYANYVRRMRKAAIATARRTQPAVVVAIGPHSAPVARAAARSIGVPNVTRLFGQALILHMHPDGRVRDHFRFFGDFSEVIAFRTPCDALIVHDDGSRADVVARHFGVEDRLHFWRDGVDLPPPMTEEKRAKVRAELGWSTEDVVVLSAGRLSVEKNLERVVTSFAESLPRCPSLRLAFVGDGPSKDALSSLASSLGVSERVIFRPSVSHEEARDRIIPAADIGISTSNRTNMTNSTLESMAAGVPVVALDTGDTSRVVRHRETGMLATDVDAIASHLADLGNDGSLRRQLGLRASELIRDEFERVPQRVQREVDLVVGLARRHGGQS